MDLKLTGKVVCITGATGGVGKATCREFIGEGCKISVTGRNAEKVAALVAELGLPEDSIYSAVADMANEDEVKAWIEGTVAKFGHLDVLVCNAGYEGKWEGVDAITKGNLERVLGTNLYGPIWCIKYAAPTMIAQGKGAVVVVSSDGALLGAPAMGVYCASKHAVQAIVKTAAIELGPKGINVNSINPGGIDTQMIENIENNAFGTEGTHEEKSKVFTANYFDKRYATPEECASMIAYLSSYRASHMFGERVSIDGGEAASRP